MRALLLALSLLAASPAPPNPPALPAPLAPSPETIADIQVHGNTLTPDARIVELSGVHIGSPFMSSTTTDVERRLQDAHLFERVEVLKRFASITDPSQVSLVIVVDEGRVEVFGEVGEAPAGVRKRGGLDFMVMPLLSGEDGYGLTYGGQFAFPQPVGPGSRISIPLTWGGDKRAAIEAEAPMARGPFTRLKAGAAISRREHPLFDQNADRHTGWLRAERDLNRLVRIGGSATLERLTFQDDGERHAEFGVDALIDTRIDPFLPGNAVYARAAWSRLQFDRSRDAVRSDLEARGYISAPHSSIVVLRALRQSSTAPLPPAMKPILGGTSNLRGFLTGTAVGDTLVAASVEWRVPLNSPLSRGKVGVSAFVDIATAYDHGERLRDQDPRRGVGGGAWLAAAVFRANLYVARGVGDRTRAHFTISTSF